MASPNPFMKAFAIIKANEKMHMAWCVTGIVGCLLLYGVLQERIIAEEYVAPDGEGERFTATLFIVMCNRLVTCAVAATMLILSGQSLVPQAPIWNYAAVSGSNVVATYCQYEALKYVSFPVQTLGKCAKMIPVMIWGTLVNAKVYKGKDYLIAFLVTGGCVMFAMTGSISSKHSKNMAESSIFGISLMLGYLGFDGFTSTWQDKMFKGYSMSIYNQILFVQLCSACVSITMLLALGQMFPAIDFLARHPDCLMNIIVLSLAATIGQLFISYTIKTFGALLFATVMTTRQFLSILLSCFLFFHPLSFGQILATLIIFGTLYYKNLSSQKKHEGGGKAAAESAAPPAKDIEMGDAEPSALERLIAASNK